MGRLDVHEHLDFQLKLWRIQRALWAVTAACLAAALLGVMGGGVVSRRTAFAPSGWECTLERFARRDMSTDVHVWVPTAGARTATVQVSFSRSILDRVRIISIDPAPVREWDDGQGQSFEFIVGEGADLNAKFALEHASAGRVEGWLWVNSEAVRISQWVYP